MFELIKSFLITVNTNEYVHRHLKAKKKKMELKNTKIFLLCDKNARRKRAAVAGGIQLAETVEASIQFLVLDIIASTLHYIIAICTRNTFFFCSTERAYQIGTRVEKNLGAQKKRREAKLREQYYTYYKKIHLESWMELNFASSFTRR